MVREAAIFGDTTPIQMRVRQVFQGNGETTRTETVYCPAFERPWRVGERTRSPVRELMTTHVLCVRSDVSVEALRSLLLERRISAAPVVDERGAPIGMVSQTDLVQHGSDIGETEIVERNMEAGFHETALAEATVADIMAPAPMTLFEDATISQVAAAMAYEGAHSVPIVGQDGTVVGIVSALDIVGWYAQREGYVLGIPRHERPQEE